MSHIPILLQELLGDNHDEQPQLPNTSKTITRFQNPQDLQQKATQAEKKTKYQRLTQSVIDNLIFNREFKDQLLKTQKDQISDLVDSKITQFQLTIDDKFSNQSRFLHNIAQAMRLLETLVVQQKDTMNIIKYEFLESQKQSIYKTEKAIEATEQLKDELTEKLFLVQETCSVIQLKTVQFDEALQRLKNDFEISAVKDSQIQSQRTLEIVNKLKISIISDIQNESNQNKVHIRRIEDGLQQNLQDLSKETKETIFIQNNNMIILKQNIQKCLEELKLHEKQNIERELQQKHLFSNKDSNQELNGDLLKKMKKLVEVMVDVLNECKKTNEYQPKRNNSTQITSSSREGRYKTSQFFPYKLDLAHNTDNDDFNDRNMFRELTPKLERRPLHVVGLGQGIKRPDSMKRQRIDTLQSEITHLVEMMQVKYSIYENSAVLRLQSPQKKSIFKLDQQRISITNKKLIKHDR